MDIKTLVTDCRVASGLLEKGINNLNKKIYDLNGELLDIQAQLIVYKARTNKLERFLSNGMETIPELEARDD